TKSSFSVWYDGRSSSYKNIGAYFPDFAMKVNPSTIGIINGNFATFRTVVPAVKLFTDSAAFSVTVTPTPAVGALTVSFPNGNKIRTYPDSVLVRINAAPNTTAGTYVVTVSGAGSNGTPVHVRTVSLNVGLVSVVDETGVPEKFELLQNYPNPFNPDTKISYNLVTQTNVKITIYDASGKLISTINKGIEKRGSYSVNFNAADLSSGVYYYKLETDNFIDTKKMLLIK
ncbi:MAG: T9SS type A sorting domain-containing protein, partial [bacterium]